MRAAVVPAGLGLAALLPGAAPDLLDQLVRRSPFVPQAAPEQAVQEAAPGELELKGVVFENGRFMFSVYDPGRKRSDWAALNEKGLGEDGPAFVAKSYDREHDALTVEYQGKLLKLVLQKAQTRTAESAPSPPPPPPLPVNGQQQAPAATPPTRQPSPEPPQAQPAPSPSDARRAEIMDEVRGRRNVKELKRTKGLKD